MPQAKPKADEANDTAEDEAAKPTRQMPDVGIDVVDELPPAPARGRQKVYDNLLRIVAHNHKDKVVRIATFHSPEGAAQGRRSFYTESEKDKKEVPGGNIEDWTFEARKGSGPVDQGGNGIPVGDSCLYVTFTGDPSTVPAPDGSDSDES